MICKYFLKALKIFPFLLFWSCYTFTGSSLDERYQTVNIMMFPNYAPLQNPKLSQQFTEDLKLRFDQRTRMSLTNTDEANIIISGEITNYNVTPVDIVSGDRAAKNRLTITIKVDYINNVEEDKGFTKSYSQYEDFEANQSLDMVEDEMVQEINQKLIDLIYNDIVADW